MVESRDVVIDRANNLEYRRETTMIKGNPAKRRRSVSPLVLTMACSSSSSEELASSVVVAGCDNISSSSSGVGIEEEEDMANCLILLARGERVKPAPSPSNRGNSGCVSANGNGGGSKADGGRLDSYQCKTCSRCFPSFHALGGHRASHKRPRLLMNEHRSEKKTSCVMIRPPVLGGHHTKADNKLSFTALSLQIPTVATAPATQISASKLPKVHDCLICGAKFNSGQALGGHMRRHRTVVAAPPITSISMDLSTSSSNISFDDHPARKNSGKHLDLDLNLPAPLEDYIGSSSVNTAVIV